MGRAVAAILAEENSASGHFSDTNQTRSHQPTVLLTHSGWQQVEIRLDNGRVEFKPDSTEVAEGNGDKG